MWRFINQNGWILLFVGMMFFMHRPGGAGCCGGHQHGANDENPNGDRRNLSGDVVDIDTSESHRH